LVVTDGGQHVSPFQALRPSLTAITAITMAAAGLPQTAGFGARAAGVDRR
jgi:hypothetical protein